MFGRIFTDFGQEWEVLDKDGEELLEFVIEDISKEEKATLTLIKGSKHNLMEGDVVYLHSIQGEGLEQLNDTY